MLLTLPRDEDVEFPDSTRKRGGEFNIPHSVMRMVEQWQVVARMTAPKGQLAAQARCTPVWLGFKSGLLDDLLTASVTPPLSGS